ncbi:MAG TPA: plastocyanin/azurin family copper-binding protein, partial [Thermoplasmata archaeon]
PPPVILPGQSFQLTFNTAGTFTYFCKVHAWKVGETWVGMVGTVHVVPSLSAEAINTLTVVSYIGVALAAVALVISLVATVRRKP